MFFYIYFYNALLLFACIYAWRKGGQPERLATWGWAVACVATFLLVPYVRDTTWSRVNLTILAIDAAVFLWFVAIALVANRFWPIWVAGIHLLAIAVHGVKGFDPTLLPYLYSVLAQKMGYPVLALLMIGVARHQGRLRAYGLDRDWSYPRSQAA